MKSTPSPGARLFWPIFILLAILTIFQGIRSARVVTMVLANGRTPLAAPEFKSPEQDPISARLDRKAELLASVTPGARDPFHDPPAPRPTTSNPPRPQAPQPAKPPGLRTLLYDRIRPSVQLSSEDGSSAWLHVGDSYRGWKVTEITENSVKITQGSQIVVLKAF
jgi:hypothetical protein